MPNLGVLNLSFYRFVELPELLPLREELRAFCRSLDLRGTILLAEEGINGFVAGEVPRVRELQRRLREVPGLEDLEFKESVSAERPFHRMLVKIKREIIPMGRPDVKPSSSTGPRVTPIELKQWLDEGREVVLLDTRNDYEVKLGTFRGAKSFDLQKFRDFPERLRAEAARDPKLRNTPVVMFCTGGIRCEKATAAALADGLNQVYQLDGGILRYFEQCGGEHYEGDCFVFDQRVAVDSNLRETAGATQCFECREPFANATERQNHAAGCAPRFS